MVDNLKTNFLELETEAKDVLDKNNRGNYTCPNIRLYPYQWLWDSCFISIGLAHYDIEKAKQEILSLFEGQWANGMMPNILMWKHNNEGDNYNTSNERIWRSWLNPASPNELGTSGITQPPVIAEAVVKIGEKMSPSERRDWYKQVYPKLLKYHQWIFEERDPHGEGLALLIHPWECGMDNTAPWMQELSEHSLPLWLKALMILRIDMLLGLFRRDTQIVKGNQRITNVEALSFFAVQRRLRRKRYNFDKIIDHSLFAIEDLTFNSILIKANKHLKEISRTIDKKLPEDLIERMGISEKALEDLWDDYAQEYFSRDFVSHRLLKESSIASFMPLYSGSISKEKAKIIVDNLSNTHRYKTPYPVPTSPITSDWFNPQRYWQGPTWINTNWLIIEGLKNYGFDKEANELKEKTLKLVNKSGIYEYFDPLNGTPLGSNNFSWTAALAIDLINS